MKWSNVCYALCLLPFLIIDIKAGVHKALIMDKGSLVAGWWADRIEEGAYWLLK